jgi:hypothetical protein
MPVQEHGKTGCSWPLRV